MLAAMPSRADTSFDQSDPQPQHVRGGRQLLTGHFQATPSYVVHRAGGCDDWLLFATESGRGLIQDQPATPGMLHLLAPRREHRYRVDPEVGAWTFLWVHVLPQPQWAPVLTWPAAGPGVTALTITDSAAFAAICAHLRAMHDHALGTAYHRDALALNALEAALLLADAFHPESPAAAEGRLDPRLRLVIERVARDLAHPWDVDAMAAIAGWSPSRFAHRFRDDLGETPRAFVERLRLDRGRQLLVATAMTVQAIAAEVGFDDPFHFSNRMRAVTGRSPTEWREDPIESTRRMGLNKP